MMVMTLLEKVSSWNTHHGHANQNTHGETPIFHPMPPNPEPYHVTYDDGTVSPLLRLRARGDETDPSFLVYEETLDGFTVKPVAKAKGKYVYVDVDELTNRKSAITSGTCRVPGLV